MYERVCLFLPGVNASLDVHVGLAIVAIPTAADLDDDHVGALERLSDGLQAGHVLVSGFLVEENSAHSNHIPSNVQTIGSFKDFKWNQILLIA